MHSVIVAPHNGKNVIIIVFHADSLDRLKSNDPAIVEGSVIPYLAQMGFVSLPRTDFMICYEPDQAAFSAKCRELKEPKAILQWLGRGWQNRPGERDTVISISTIQQQPEKEG
jgi:hypothetical protein